MVSSVDLMPGQEYKFTYKVIPLKLGMLELPRFSISKRHPEKEDLESQLFLIKDHTSKVLVVSSWHNIDIIFTKNLLNMVEEKENLSVDDARKQ